MSLMHNIFMQIDMAYKVSRISRFMSMRKTTEARKRAILWIASFCKRGYSMPEKVQSRWDNFAHIQRQKVGISTKHWCKENKKRHHVPSIDIL
jgi:hypothetical protein